MKHLLKLLAIAICILYSLNTLSQVNPFPYISLGADIGQGLSSKIKSNKKKKIIQSSIKKIKINGDSILILRVSEDQIISNAKGFVIRIQSELDNYYSLTTKSEHLDFPIYNHDISTLKLSDNEWPTEYYEQELAAYKKYEQKLVLRERHIKDSIETAKRIEQKRVADSLQIVRMKYNDSMALSERTRGYVFVAKQSTPLKEKPSLKSNTLGYAFKGSYLKILGSADTSTFLKVAIEDIVGFVNKNDITDSIQKIKATDADIAIYKSRRYYEYQPNTEFIPSEETQPKSTSVYNSSGSTKSTTKKAVYNPTKHYIRGPRGGCYYMSGSSKVYVDRSFCN